MKIWTLTYGVSVNRKFAIAASLAPFALIVLNSTPSHVKDLFGRFGSNCAPSGVPPGSNVANNSPLPPDKCW